MKICLSLLVLVMLFAFTCNAHSDTAQQGRLNLNNTNFELTGMATLDGEWKFYWKQFLTPEEINKERITNKLISIPGLWNHNAVHGTNYDRFGYASLAINIKLPDNEKHYFLRLPSLPSAYVLWANGERVASNGVVGTNPIEEQAWTSPKVIPLFIDQAELQLVLHISNYHHKEGGVWRSLVLANSENFFTIRVMPIITDSLLFSFLFFTGLYYLALFIMRRSEWAALYFGLFCLAIASRSILISERILYELIPDLSWSILQMIEHQLFFVCVPIFLWFFYHIYPQQVGRKLPWSCTLACTIPIFLTLVFPLHVYAQALFPYQIFVSLIAFIISIHLIKLVIRKQKDAIYFSFSFLILFIFTLHDVLLSHFVINGRPIVQFGVIAFIISQSFILQRRYVNSLSLVQTMAEELKLRNNELIKVDQVKDEFLAYTSHELRTPIHGIVGLTSTLLKDNRNPLSHGQNHQLKLIESSARRLGNLVNDILDFSKLKHQELSIRLIRVDLSAVLGVTLKILDPLIDRSKINFKLDIPAQLPAVQADENRLQQILFNLIGNAIKFTAQGEIRVTVKYHKNHVHISISDNGPGIAKNQRDLLFEPFKQLNNNIEGTGLGLSITKKLVELHNSELSILSKEGEGTNVQFSLAIASEELINQAADIQLVQSEQDKNIPFSQQKMQQQTLNMDSLPANQKTTILVVDDEEVNRQVISSQLSLEGYHVLVSHSGEEALLILEKTKPHLILLDLMMPHMNGFEVCSAIREQYNRFELPVLMLTASHQINDVVKAINIGANDYLYKPYHDIEMLARVHNLISASESQKNSDENQQLKIEVQRRKQTQKKLRQANQRLTNILNSASEAVLLLNNHYQIIYSNQAAKYLLDDDITRLKGLTIDHVISTTFYHELSSIPFVELNTSKHMLAASHQDSSGATQELNIFTSSFELKGNTYINLFIQPKNNPADKQSADHILQTFSHELISNRNKITALEKVIHEIANNGSIISVNSETTLKPLDRASSGQDPRSFLVSALRLTIDLWEKYTNKSKIELAEESNIWRIYLDGSTAKTRTLDKYLSIKSLPKNPRWRPVIRTANYIKLNCPLSSKEDEQLTELIQQIEYEYLEIGPNSE